MRDTAVAREGGTTAALPVRARSTRPLLVLVHGHRIAIQQSAVDQYAERVRPSLSRESAEDELAFVAHLGTITGAAPEWSDPTAANVRARSWLVLGDGIVFPVDARGRAHACYTRASVGDEAREARRRKRRERRIAREVRRRRRTEYEAA